MANATTLRHQAMPSDNKPINDYARWSGRAFQMMATMGLCVWGGLWLDKRLAMRFPVFTLCLAVVGFATSITLVYRAVINRQ